MLALACCMFMAQVPVVPVSPYFLPSGNWYKNLTRLQLIPMARALDGPLSPHQEAHALSPGIFSVRLWDSPVLVTLP